MSGRDRNVSTGNGSRWRRIAIVIGKTLLWAAVAFRVRTPLILADEYVYLVRGCALDRLARLEEIAPAIPSLGNYLFLRIINLLTRSVAPVDLALKLVIVGCIAVLGIGRGAGRSLRRRLARRPPMRPVDSSRAATASRGAVSVDRHGELEPG